MKSLFAICLLASGAVLRPGQPAAAAELDALAASASHYESGGSAEPLRQLEQRLRDSVGDPQTRAACEAALIRLLATESTFEAKRFACAQLAVHGSEASLPALAELLKQEETAGIACFALVGARSPKAGDLLRAALPEAKGAGCLQVIGALGRRAESASVTPLAGFARDTDPTVAAAAVRALGAIDDDKAREAVAALRREAKPAAAVAVAEASLCGARQLVAARELAAASAICGELLDPAGPPQIRRGAFGLLLQCDADEGLGRVLRTLEARPLDAVLMPVALARVPDMRAGDVSRRAGAVLPRLPPEGQVLLIGALACRADTDARAVIRAQISAEDPGVRHAAVGAVGTLEGADAVPLLTRALAAAPTPDEARDIQLALAGLSGGEGTDQAICDALRQAAAKDKPPLMAVLSRRGGPAAVSALLAQSGGADGQVARAAAQALVRIADGGDAAALAALQAAVADGDARVREAALRTLAAWRGLAAWETLAGIYLKPENAAQHALALRGLVRIAGEGNARPDAALIGRYRQLLDGARSDDERKLILNVLAGAGHPDALALALPLLDLNGVRPEAAQAVERIASALAATHPEISRDALRRAKSGGVTP